MAKNIIEAIRQEAIRQHPFLKGACLLTALEMAHRASSKGHLHVSYSYLASKTGMSIHAMIAHVKRLEILGILRKETKRLSATRNAINHYVFLVKITPLKRERPQYTKYLSSNHWRTVRHMALRAAGHRCSTCKRVSHLNVHHRSYAHLGHEHEYMDDIVVLCRKCHAKEHGIEA